MITASRLVLAVLLFVLLGCIEHAQVLTLRGSSADWIVNVVRGRESFLLNVALCIFALAAFSDVLDGHIARKYGLTTDFGRIVDPFADKVIVCGAFVQLVPMQGSMVASWMVVVILARELMVDGLRGFAESKGVKFPAMWSGKLKMGSQSICIMWILWIMGNHSGEAWAVVMTRIGIWWTIAVTVLSGAHYLMHARKVLEPGALGELTADQPDSADAPAPAGDAR